MKLNLGSGKRPMEGYINIDAVAHTPETLAADVLHLDYPDNSVERIFSEHLIEHLDKPELELFFSECRRMLVLGGELELITPDFIRIVNKYANKEIFGPCCPIVIDEHFLEGLLYQGHKHPYDYHKQGIFKKRFEELCERHGFEVIKIWSQDRDHSENELCLLARKVK